MPAPFVGLSNGEDDEMIEVTRTKIERTKVTEMDDKGYLVTKYV